MEHTLSSRSALLLLIMLTLSSCTKHEDIAENANQRFIQSMDWNNNHPYREIIVKGNDYMLLAMGDSHVGGTNNLDSFIKIAKTKKVAAAVMAGDLTSGQEKDYKVFEQHLPPQDSLFTFLVAGNHDLFSNGWKEYYSMFGSSSYLFTIETPTAADLFICLETGGGTLGTRQLDWLTNLLKAKRPGYRNCVVITHNNILRTRHTDSTNPPVEETEVLLELFTKYHVDMAITGHDHKQDATVFGITKYIIMDTLKDGESNAGYLQIRVKNGTIGYEFENL